MRRVTGVLAGSQRGARLGVLFERGRCRAHLGVFTEGARRGVLFRAGSLRGVERLRRAEDEVQLRGQWRHQVQIGDEGRRV